MDVTNMMQMLGRSAHKGEVIDLKTPYEFAIRANVGDISEKEKSEAE